MEKLSASFKREIEAHPEDYFLTFDMYDLLIDEWFYTISLTNTNQLTI